MSVLDTAEPFIAHTPSRVAGPLDQSKWDGYEVGQVRSWLMALRDRTAGRVNVLEFIPPSLHSAIRSGTNVTDLTVYIQAAIDSLRVGARVRGVLEFPWGTYRITQSLVLGHAGDTLEVVIRGQGIYAGPNSPAGATVISNESTTAPTFTFAFTGASTVKFDGLTIRKPAGSTGAAFHFDPAGEAPVGWEWEDVTVHRGDGINFASGTTMNKLRRVTLYGTTNYGISFGGPFNVYDNLDEVLFQSGEAHGVVIQQGSYLDFSRWTSCIFEFNAGADLKLMGRLSASSFSNCAWEYSRYQDLIWIAPGSTGVNGGMRGVDFYDCVFDGSDEVRNVINNTTPIGDYVQGNTISFIGGGVYNLGGGKVLAVPQAPQDASYPGYANITVRGMNAVVSGGPYDFDGIYPADIDPAQLSVFQDRAITADNILAGYAGVKPAYVLLGQGGVTTNVNFSAPRVQATMSSGLTGLTLVPGVPVVIDASLGNEFTVYVGDQLTDFTISNPVNAVRGQRVSIRVVNASGGVLGTITWGDKYKMSAWTNPADGFGRVIDVSFNSVDWWEVSRTPADVPND